MYKIGEFSLLNKVTIKTLRYYNEIGLFIPKVIDKYTGYRYYDEDQLEEFNKIESDMTYEQVKEIIGSDGTLTSDVSIGDEKYHTQIYMWYGNTITGGNANVTFQNGKVVGKAQVGLK